MCASTLIQAGNKNTTGAELYEGMQDVLDFWDGALRASGGAIAHDKSYWHLVDFKHTSYGWDYKTKADVPGELILPEGDERTPKVFERLEPHQAKELLGIMIRPDGGEADQARAMLKKARQWRDSIRSKKIKKMDAWYAMNCTIMKTIEYPLMATTLSRAQLDTVMSPILTAALPKAGIQRHMPRAIVHGSHNVQGHEVHHPAATQTIQHVQAIMRHGVRMTMTGPLLRSLMEEHILEVGSSTPFWQLPYDKWGPLCTWTWMMHTWKDLWQAGMTLCGPLQAIPLLRLHDACLMDVFMSLDCFSHKELRTLRDCRMHLEVTRVSDVATADGTAIHFDSWQGKKLDRGSPYEWPRSYRPGWEAWETWRKALKTLMLPHARHRKLAQPLGAWHKRWDEDWVWWFSPSTNNVYQHQDSRWTLWIPNARHYLPSNALPCPVPRDIVRVDVSKSRLQNYVTLQRSETHFPGLHPNSLLDEGAKGNVYDILQDLPSSLQWAVYRSSIPNNGAVIAEAIRAGTAVAVSDASLKAEFGTSAFVLEGDSCIDRITGVNIVPGPIQEGDSYRCELAGLTGIAVILQTLCNVHSIHQGCIQIACDNKSTLRIFNDEFIPEPTQESFDLVCCLSSIIKAIPIQCNATHVDGHVADWKPKHRMTRLELLNDEMDHTAKAFWNHLLSIGHPMHPPVLSVHQEGWSLWKGPHKYTSARTEDLYADLEDHRTIEHWTHSHHIQPQPRIPPEAIANVDWESCGACMRSLDMPRRIWTGKHGSENCGVGVTQQSWGKQSTCKCPRCGLPETAEHVYLCRGEQADVPWQENLSKLETYMANTDTHPAISQILLHRLNSYHNSTPVLFGPSAPPDVLQAATAQDNIGWRNMLEGIPAKQWTVIQCRHYKQHAISHMTGKRWIKGLLKCLHNLAHGQWMHRNAVMYDPDLTPLLTTSAFSSSTSRQRQSQPRRF